ncbi:MAG TPA: Wzz/FepE/Etk N-terminal domain-containing protein, partial [Chthoniobacterales bacterium]|nr:Wzz/FepE/Etk N-terminal domain-containing protein [Chthoniobacterales bacterium]
MPIAPPEAHQSSVNLPNVLSALFKHKKKIMLAAAVGLAAAAAVHFFYPATYESDATLLVRYVLDRSAVDPENTDPRSMKTNDTVIDAEVQILKSWDLAVQVAQALGPKRILPNAKTPSVESAAGAIGSGLDVTTKHASNIMFVAYQDSNREVANLVLNELVNRYFTKHLEVHRSAGAFDFVTQQTDQVRARLNQTEDALKTLKTKAGILSLPDSIAALGTEVARLNEQLSAAESDLAEQRARVKEMTQAAGQPSPSN